MKRARTMKEGDTLFIDAGTDEIMFGLLRNNPEDFQRLDDEVLSAFD